MGQVLASKLSISTRNAVIGNAVLSKDFHLAIKKWFLEKWRENVKMQATWTSPQAADKPLTIRKRAKVERMQCQ